MLVIAFFAVACSLPHDPDGTLDRVRADHVLRVGASPSDGRVSIGDGRAEGPEPDLAEAFADSIGAEVEWHPGGEEELVGDLEAGRVDLLIGGLTDKSPWLDKVALTRPYDERSVDGETHKLVMAVPLGENALLVALEKFLDEETS